MPTSEHLDEAFRTAVAALDAGDTHALTRLLHDTPALASARLEHPGPWLLDALGGSLPGFFERPYLLWFVAEDPVRNGTLPSNIAEVTRGIIAAIRTHAADTLQHQVDYCLQLVSWSWIARDAGVHLALIDVLVDAGAATDGRPNDALVNGNTAAAAHLIARGAPVTLAAAVCLDRWDDVTRLGPTATPAQRQFALVLAALNGNAMGVRALLDVGADVNQRSPELWAHASPLHHAVSSGSLAAVQTLVDAGADLTAVDTAWGGTPLSWAQHYVEEATVRDRSASARPAIHAYLKSRSG
jgi:Ankyrin repeats (3 copies)